jgi:hypothetical protein
VEQNFEPLALLGAQGHHVFLDHNLFSGHESPPSPHDSARDSENTTLSRTLPTSLSLTMKKDRDDAQHQPTRAPRGGAAQAMCAAQACLSQARPQMRAYSITKARQQAGEVFIIRGGQWLP